MYCNYLTTNRPLQTRQIISVSQTALMATGMETFWIMIRGENTGISYQMISNSGLTVVSQA